MDQMNIRARTGVKLDKLTGLSRLRLIKSTCVLGQAEAAIVVRLFPARLRRFKRFVKLSVGRSKTPHCCGRKGAHTNETSPQRRPSHILRTMWGLSASRAVAAQRISQLVRPCQGYLT